MELNESPYLQAASVLPPTLRALAEALPGEEQRRIEEFRLRAGQPLSVLSGNRERLLGGAIVTQENLRDVLGQGSRYSAHAVHEQLCAGFLPIQGGHRIGLCGAAIVKDGSLYGFRAISSLSIRIAKPITGGAAAVAETLCTEDGKLMDTLILASPGVGKTTLLRDLVRCISDGIGLAPCRVGLADERREVSALWNGQAQFDIGRRTDIMADCPKAVAVQILVRGMNPQVIAMDEITAEEDLDALLWAAGCGVTLLATAHARNLDSLRQRPLYQRLLNAKVFRRAVVLEQCGSRRIPHTEVIL